MYFTALEYIIRQNARSQLLFRERPSTPVSKPSRGHDAHARSAGSDDAGHEAAYGSAAGAPAWTVSAGAAGSLTRHAMSSETTHSAIPENVKVGR